MSTCPTCGVQIGQLHRDFCTVERCPDCGLQLLGCPCLGTSEQLQHPRLAWSGMWPGEMECREFGWMSKLVPGEGWVRCDADDPAAQPDLNRLFTDAAWDAGQGRWVRRQ